jgi:hypothetical protein
VAHFAADTTGATGDDDDFILQLHTYPLLFLLAPT